MSERERERGEGGHGHLPGVGGERGSPVRHKRTHFPFYEDVLLVRCILVGRTISTTVTHFFKNTHSHSMHWFRLRNGEKKHHNTSTLQVKKKKITEYKKKIMILKL